MYRPYHVQWNQSPIHSGTPAATLSFHSSGTWRNFGLQPAVPEFAVKKVKVGGPSSTLGRSAQRAPTVKSTRTPQPHDQGKRSKFKKMKDLRCFFDHVDWKRSRREVKRTELEIWEHENEKHTALSIVF